MDVDLVEAERVHGLCLALDGERSERAGLDCILDQWVGRFPDQDLARFSRLLEALGEHDRIAGDVRAAGLRVAGDHATGVDARSGTQPHPPRLVELFIEHGKPVTHLRCGADCSQRVVLVDVRDAEHRHDLVTDELLHGPAVALDDGPHLIEVAGHDPPHRLGIEAFGKLGGRHDVREEDRDRLSNEHFVESRPETSPVLGGHDRSGQSRATVYTAAAVNSAGARPYHSATSCPLRNQGGRRSYMYMSIKVPMTHTSPRSKCRRIPHGNLFGSPALEITLTPSSGVPTTSANGGNDVNSTTQSPTSGCAGTPGEGDRLSNWMCRKTPASRTSSRSTGAPANSSQSSFSDTSSSFFQKRLFPREPVTVRSQSSRQRLSVSGGSMNAIPNARRNLASRFAKVRNTASQSTGSR